MHLQQVLSSKSLSESPDLLRRHIAFYAGMRSVRPAVKLLLHGRCRNIC